MPPQDQGPAPLGNRPTRAIRDARQHIHKILDPLCKNRTYKRREVYQKISEPSALVPHR
jgi:hypothetical protein